MAKILTSFIERFLPNQQTWSVLQLLTNQTVQRVYLKEQLIATDYLHEWIRSHPDKTKPIYTAKESLAYEALLRFNPHTIISSQKSPVLDLKTNCQRRSKKCTCVPVFEVVPCVDDKKVMRIKDVKDPFKQFIEIKYVQGKGYGVFALNCCLTLKQRLGVYTGVFATYVDTDSKSDYIFEFSKHKVVDGKAGISDEFIHWSGRLNHSWDPNVKVAKNGVISVLKHFHAGDELTINYGSRFWEGSGVFPL
jgi:hypothetical protein